MVRRWEAAHPDYEDQYEEEQDDTGGGGGAFMLNPVAAAWVAAGTGRKHSVNKLDGDRVDAHSCRGAPPKRACTKELFLDRAKRCSEGLDFDERDAESASVGSAPKRARIEAVESPLDLSMPVSVPTSGKELVSASPDMCANRLKKTSDNACTKKGPANGHSTFLLLLFIPFPSSRQSTPQLMYLFLALVQAKFVPSYIQ
jgi:hypothetical protein